MASVFEVLSLKRTLDSTEIPVLGIHSRVNKLQIESQKYFTVPQNAVAKDNNILAVEVHQGQHFDLTNFEHKTFMKDAVRLFADKSAELKALDKKIGASVLLGVVASTLSFLPFVGYFALLGWGSSIYFISQRQKAYEEYTESLKLLVATCNWSLGDAPANLAGQTALTNDKEVREMMSTLYPVLTKQQACHLIDDRIEGIFAKELEDYENKYQISSSATSFFNHGDESIARSKRSAEFNRCIYGYNKGGWGDYLDAAFSIFPDIYNEIHHGIKKLQYWWNKKERDTQAENGDTPSMSMV